MRTLVALVAGLISGIVVSIAVGMLSADSSSASSADYNAVPQFIAFFVAWGLSSVLIVRGTKTASRVFARSFLLGAAVWLAYIPVFLVFSSRVSSDSLASADAAEQAGAAVATGLFAGLGAAFAGFMVFLCLMGFAVSHFMGRNMAPEKAAPTQKCPDCAELIQKEAKRCRYCGAQLSLAADGA